MDLFGLQQPFFRPLWRRIAVVAVCLGWASVEFATASPFWGIVFAAIGALAVWQFFVAPWPPDDETS